MAIPYPAKWATETLKRRTLFDKNYSFQLRENVLMVLNIVRVSVDKLP